MKLLFDENLSYRLTTALADIYPGSDHVIPFLVRNIINNPDEPSNAAHTLLV